MGKRPRKSGGLRLAEDFTAILSEEAMRAGRRRTCKAEKFVAWANSILRTAVRDRELAVTLIAHKIGWLVYGVSIRTEEAERCTKRARTFLSRHRFLLAQQVLSAVDGEVDRHEARPLLMMPAPTIVGATVGGIGRVVGRAIRKVGCRKRKASSVRS